MSNRSSAVETANHKRFDPPAIFAGYCDKKLPYFGHIALMSAFVVGFGAALARAASKRGRFNDPSWSDLFLLSIATHKISRIVTKDRVTSPVRAPFTRLTGESGSGEVEETARGQGLQRAVGELLTCPFCMGPWIAGPLLTGFTIKPRFTRLVATLFAIVTGSDFLQRVYYGAKQIGESDDSAK